MSINSLTEAEVRRSLAERAAAAGVAPPVGAAAPDGNAVSNALSMLVKYIPTESITLYVAAISAAAAALKGLWSGMSSTSTGSSASSRRSCSSSSIRTSEGPRTFKTVTTGTA